jgi:hypothetical protein
MTRVRFPAVARTFVFSTTSRLPLTSTQGPGQLLAADLSPGLKRPEREADLSELRMHGAVHKDLRIYKYLNLISVKWPEREADLSG